MKPVIIGETICWFSAGRSQRGVVLCGTFGFEQHSAHRWWRDLSEGIAATGCAVLRFDYPGEGDSKALVTQLDSALDAIRRAICFLREEAQAEEIVLVGLRIGGTLATLVAAEGGIDRLVLLAPFARGRAYLREMEMQSGLVNIVPDGSPLPKQSGILSVGGFTLNSDLRQSLSQIDLRLLDSAPAKRVLLLGPDPAGLATWFAEQGSWVEAGDFSGLARLLSDALQIRMPEATRARILDFVSGEAVPRPIQPLRVRMSSATITGAGWTEEPVQFGEGLFGIQCRPHAPLSRAPAVLFVNLGAYVHSGYGRQSTTLARTLAQDGISSLRMDLRGVGDSADRPDGELPLYKLDAVEDIRAGIDLLTRGNARPVIAVGTCNGAYLAFHAICQDPRIAAAILVNLYCFDWGLTHGGEPYAAKPVRHVSTYAAMLLNPATWHRILGGTTPVRAILCSLARRGSARLLGKLIERRKAGKPSRPIIARIADLRRRGARLVMIYSAGDLGLVDLRTQLGSLGTAVAILGEPVHIIADTDHAFSTEPAQALLLLELRKLAATLANDHYATEKDNPSSIGLTTIDPQCKLQTA